MARNENDLERLSSEAGIIASLIHNPELIFHSEVLLPKHFSNMQNKCIYHAIKILAEQGVTQIDTYSISECINNTPQLREYCCDITIEKLNELMEISAEIARNSVNEYRLLVKCVMDASFRKEMLHTLRDCQAICLDDGVTDIQKTIYQKMDEVSMSYESNDDVPQYTSNINKYWSEIQSRQGTGYAGIPFKFSALNDYVTIEKGELVIFGALQKVGKSMMLLNCAVDLLKQGYSVLYIDSELSSRLFTSRLLSHLTGIEYRRLTAGCYTPEEECRILTQLKWLEELGDQLNHIYMPFFDANTIYSTVKRESHKHRIDVIIIDYFKSTGNEVGAFETYAAMGRCVDMIKNEIAGAMDIAAIGAAQATADGRLADSAKIARNASTIALIIDKTPEEIARDGEDCGNKKLIVTINRNGAHHASGEYIDLQFDGDKVSFEQARQHSPYTPY